MKRLRKFNCHMTCGRASPGASFFHYANSYADVLMQTPVAVFSEVAVKIKIKITREIA